MSKNSLTAQGAMSESDDEGIPTTVDVESHTIAGKHKMVVVRAEDGSVAFCVHDVCKILGITDVLKATLEHSHDGGTGEIEFDSPLPNGKTFVTYVDKSTVYSMARSANKKTAALLVLWIEDKFVPDDERLDGETVFRDFVAPYTATHQELFVRHHAVLRKIIDALSDDLKADGETLLLRDDITGAIEEL